MGDYRDAINHFLIDYRSVDNDVDRIALKKKIRSFLDTHFVQCYNFAESVLGDLLYEVFDSDDIFKFYDRNSKNIELLAFEKLFQGKNDFIRDNLFNFVIRGCTLDELLNEIREPISSIEDVQKYLDMDIDFSLVMDACKNKYMAWELSDPVKMEKFRSIMSDYTFFFTHKIDAYIKSVLPDTCVS